MKNILKKSKWLKNPSSVNVVVIPKKAHGISPKKINPNALKIIRRLKKHGFEAYIVGGGIRDILLGQKPKDFDVATNARPKEIKQLFSNCRIIGRRFRLAHIYFYREIIEVATFRAGHEKAKPHEARMNNGFITRDNVYGGIEQDALRRDFTINALYYDPETEVLLDFTKGFRDIKHKKLNIIGDPATRYREDPVRMIRAARFAGKLGFTFKKSSEKTIIELAYLLEKISPSRLYDEVIKLFHCGFASQIFSILERYDLIHILFPKFFECLFKNEARELVMNMLKNTDKRIQQKKPVIPAFLFSAILWFPMIECYQILKKEQPEISKSELFQQASSQVLRKQAKRTSMPRYVTSVVREMWFLQPRLEKRHSRYIYNILKHSRFRAAYDLLVLRAQVNSQLKIFSDWWMKFQVANPHDQKNMISQLKRKKREKKGKR